MGLFWSLLCFGHYGVSWPSGLAYRTQVLVLAAECGFESRPWHLCPWAKHLIIIASLHPGVKWVPVRAELVDQPRPYMRCNGSNWAVYSPGSWDGFRNDVWALWAGGNNAPWAPLSWWIRALYKSTYYYIFIIIIIIYPFKWQRNCLGAFCGEKRHLILVFKEIFKRSQNSPECLPNFLCKGL